MGERVVVEPFCTGREFTLIIITNPDDEPVPLLPTEIGISDDIFDYRKKYLPTHQVVYHMPPRFDDATVARIRGAGRRTISTVWLAGCGAL